jgi:hypothetical protein
VSGYHDLPQMSQSKLKCLWNDPQLFAELYIHRTRPLPLPTPAMQFGSDCERYLFDGGFDDVVVIPDVMLNEQGHRKGKAWMEFAAQHAGKRLLKHSEYRELVAPFDNIKANVDACPVVSQLLYGGEKKVPILWSYMGIDMKSEIDVLHEHCIVDLKTCADPSPEGFAKQAANLGYHVQAAAYQIAVEQHTGKLLPFIFVAIANKPSYRVEAYTLSDKFLQLGRQLLGDMVEFYKLCCERDEWRSDTWGRVMEIDPPAYYERAMETWTEATV